MDNKPELKNRLCKCGNEAVGTVELQYYPDSNVGTPYRHRHLCRECLQNIDKELA